MTDSDRKGIGWVIAATLVIIIVATLQGLGSGHERPWCALARRVKAGNPERIAGRPESKPRNGAQEGRGTR